MSIGVVRQWSDEEGWGVVDCPETPGGCWVHFSHIAHHIPNAYRRLSVGDVVEFTWLAVDQDGYDYRAESVRVLPPE